MLHNDHVTHRAFVAQKTCAATKLAIEETKRRNAENERRRASTQTR